MVDRAIPDLLGRQFIRFGKIAEVDLTGEAADNRQGLHPAYKVEILESGGMQSPWLQQFTPATDETSEDYIPLKEGAIVALMCPGGRVEQSLIVGAKSTTPTAAGSTTEERAARRVIRWGSNIISLDKTDGKHQVRIETARGHFIVLRDEVNSQGIVVQTAKGHIFAMADLDPAARVTLQHRGGTGIVMDENGNLTITVMNDFLESIGGDRSSDVAGDSTMEVGGAFTAHAQEVMIEGDSRATLKSAGEVDLATAGAMLAPIVTGFPNGTWPRDPLTGLPVLGCMRVKAEGN